MEVRWSQWRSVSAVMARVGWVEGPWVRVRLLFALLLSLSQHLTKSREVVFRDFFAFHEAGDEGREATVEDAVEEAAAFFELALVLIDGGRVAELAAHGLDGKRTFFGESADEGLHGARFPVQAAFEFAHDFAERAGAAFPQDFHDGPFGVGDAGRGGDVVVGRHDGLQT